MGIAYHTGNSALGMKNLLINSNGLVNQRGYVSGTATTVANQYTVDRWRVVTLGQNLTFTTTNGVTTFTAPAGGVEQVIENLNVLGGSYVLTVGGTATALVAESADNVTYTTITPVDGKYTITGGKYVKVTFSGGTFSLPQFERGTIATPYAHVDIGVDAAKCQRYLPVIIVSGYMYHGQCLSSTNGSVTLPFSVTPRVIPTGMTYTGTLTCTLANGTAHGTGVSFVLSSLTAARVLSVGATSLVAGDATTLYSAGSVILFTGCEL